MEYCVTNFRLLFPSIFSSVNLFIDIHVATLSPCLAEYICQFGFCYLHQSRSPDRSLCYIDDNVFAVSAVALIVLADLSLLDNHVAH